MEDRVSRGMSEKEKKRNYGNKKESDFWKEDEKGNMAKKRKKMKTKTTVKGKGK